MKKLALESEETEGTSSSKRGSTLSYDLRFMAVPSVSYAKIRHMQLYCLLALHMRVTFKQHNIIYVWIPFRLWEYTL